MSTFRFRTDKSAAVNLKSIEGFCMSVFDKLISAGNGVTPTMTIDLDGLEVDVSWICDGLEDSIVAMPDKICKFLRLPKGSTYAAGARRVMVAYRAAVPDATWENGAVLVAIWKPLLKEIDKRAADARLDAFAEQLGLADPSERATLESLFGARRRVSSFFHCSHVINDLLSEALSRKEKRTVANGRRVKVA